MEGALKTIEEKKQTLINEFKDLNTWEDKYRKIILLGKDLPELKKEYYQDKYKVKGCQSQIWLASELKDGKVYYFADSDAMIVKGIAALLIHVFSGHSPEEVYKSDAQFLDIIGIKQHLSMNRSNGLTQLLKQIKLYAMVFWQQLKLSKQNA